MRAPAQYSHGFMTLNTEPLSVTNIRRRHVIYVNALNRSELYIKALRPKPK